MKRCLPMFALALGAATVALSVAAADPAKKPVAAPPAQAEVAAAVRRAAEAYETAFNHGDAAALAALWTADGEYVDERGERFVGREAIRKEYAGFFAAHPGVKLSSTIDSVRVLAPNAAMEDGRAVLHPAPPGAPAQSRYSAVYVLEDGHWLLSTVHDTRVEQPSNFGRLSDLEWLVGTWTGEEGIARFTTRYRWLGNKSYLEKTYEATHGELVTASGTQIIGWDPDRGQIHSWTFSSDAGHTQGLWRASAGGWSSEQRGQLADGTKTAALNVLTRLDNDTLAWRSSHRTAGGQHLPDLEEIVLKRVQDQ